MDQVTTTEREDALAGLLAKMRELERRLIGWVGRPAPSVMLELGDARRELGDLYDQIADLVIATRSELRAQRAAELERLRLIEQFEAGTSRMGAP